MPERDVHLLLSQKAACALERLIVEAYDEEAVHDEDGQILDAIKNDLRDQIEQPKKKSKRRKS